MVAEVGEFEAEGALRVLKKARRCRRGPVIGCGPEYANLVFTHISDDPNTWIKAFATSYEDLNRKILDISASVDQLCVSLERSLKIVDRREKVGIYRFRLTIFIFHFFRFFRRRFLDLI